MRTALLIVAALLLTFASEGAQARAPAARTAAIPPLSACTGLARVAARPATDPTRCCAGGLSCAQPLSTMITIRPRRDQRT